MASEPASRSADPWMRWRRSLHVDNAEERARPAIGHRFPLADTAEAMRVVFERRALGKVVIEMPV